MIKSARSSIVVVTALALGACGGSDASDSSDGAADTSQQDESDSTDADDDDTAAAGGALDGAREAPCDVVPVSLVNEALGGTYEATPDEFGELVCQYTGDATFGIAWGPGFDGSVRSNFERGEGDATEIAGLGDFAYQYLNLELAFALNGDAISIQGDLDMATQGVALAEAIIAEIG